MMYYVLVVKKYNKLGKSENKICSRTIYYGSQILELMFTERDTYFMNYLNRKQLPTYLFQVLSITSNNEDFTEVNLESEKLEKLYYSFFIFELDKKELIKEVNNVLEKIINLSKNMDINAYLLKSNFCFIICKIFYVIDFNELEEEKQDSEFNNIIKLFFSNFFLFLHYFIENNEYHSLIIMSHYILQGILKIPITYFQCLIISNFPICCSSVSFSLSNKQFSKALIFPSFSYIMQLDLRNFSSFLVL